MRRQLLAALAIGAVGVTAGAQAPAERPRARDLGLAPGVFEPGPLNAITDVAGVAVGHTTLRDGDGVRTGVTAVVPHDGNLFQDKVAGGVFVGNAFGKLAGSTQVQELGTIETPIVLTNTLAVGAGVEGVVQWTLAQDGNADVRSVNALVGETNDGGLNDIRTLSVRPAHVVEAIRGARGGAVAEGSVGAGTGTRAFGWKGGIGTSSRRLPARFGGYTVGVLVQSNYGGVLTMGGAPVGRELGRYDYAPSAAAGRRRRLLHDCRRDRRAARRPRPHAARRPRRLRAGPHRLVVLQRQRRLRHRLHHARRAARGVRRPGAAPADDPADRRRVAALRSGARGHRGGGLQLAAQGDHGDEPGRHGRGDSGGPRARDPEEVRGRQRALNPSRMGAGCGQEPATCATNKGPARGFDPSVRKWRNWQTR